MFAIVPAHNEQATIADVVIALVGADVFDGVIVVDDGSSDATATLAEMAGAKVLELERNVGKGGAMEAGVRSLPPDYDAVAFFDADLVGLRPDHARALVKRLELGYDMVCGLRDKGPISNALQLLLSPTITGERAVKRWILEAVPLSCWRGYSIETAMNDAAARRGGRTLLTILEGVSMRTKSNKLGFSAGVRGHARMLREIVRTREALRRSGGTTCDT